MGLFYYPFTYITSGREGQGPCLFKLNQLALCLTFVNDQVILNSSDRFLMFEKTNAVAVYYIKKQGTMSPEYIINSMN